MLYQLSYAPIGRTALFITMGAAASAFECHPERSDRKGAKSKDEGPTCQKGLRAGM